MLEVTNIMYNHDQKFQIRVVNCCFLLRLVHFVSHAPVKHSLYCNVLNNVRFRFETVYFLEELWLDMQSWWS
jgi:hypothetical protein